MILAGPAVAGAAFVSPAGPRVTRLATTICDELDTVAAAEAVALGVTAARPPTRYRARGRLATSSDTLATYPEPVGAEASRLLLERIDLADLAPRKVILEPRLSVRASSTTRA